MGYVFHKLDIKGVLQETPDYWYKLKWKPIKNGTYNFYITKEIYSFSCHMVGIRWYRSNAHNGWGRSWDGFNIDIGFYWFTISFWLHYNFACMADDTFDTGDDKYKLTQEKANRWRAKNLQTKTTQEGV